MSRDGLWIDVGNARQFAGQINGGLGQMQGLIGMFTSMLGEIFWEGDDKRNFEADWHGSFRPEAERATQGLRDTSAEFLRRAAAQEELSNRGH